MTNLQGVTLDSPPNVETVTPEGQEVVIEETPSQPSKPPKGFVPYDALREERDKTELLERKLAETEQEVAELKTSLSPEEEDPKVSALAKQVTELREERELEKVIGVNPKLKEFETELKEFRQEHPRAKWETVAKLFLVEKGLLEAPRQGLETTTGGGTTTPRTQWTFEKMADLRKTNYKQYADLLQAGEFKDVK